MRGEDQQQSHMFSYLSPEARVRKDHPLRALRAMMDEALSQLSRQFDSMYARVGRPSIAPEKLLRAQVLQMLYTIRSERLLMEEMDYNLLFRWFVGLNADDEVWDATTFTKNRDRLLEADVAKEFLAVVVEQARGQGLISDEHFTVDGTLLEAWASAKSFKPKEETQGSAPDDPGNPTVNFRGEKRSNETHESKTDPEARLARKGAGKESKLSYSGNLLVENRNGLIVDAEVFQANGTAERDAALIMLEQIEGTQPLTVGGDKGFDTRDFVKECRHMRVTPHVAQNLERRGGSAIDGRTTRHPGYAISQNKRKRIEECFGWLKTIALLRKVRHRGVCKVHWIFTLACAAYNLVRMRNLAAAVRLA
ncbi:MAG TPA: IS5 family transposase [Phototrophicaceae bacterium]|nr:IS5 family transposase [Phototrophicaceae bacterium]